MGGIETWPADWWHPFILVPFYVAIAGSYLWYANELERWIDENK
jgi:ABC-type uncharacterized transport system permease subunit